MSAVPPCRSHRAQKACRYFLVSVLTHDFTLKVHMVGHGFTTLIGAGTHRVSRCLLQDFGKIHLYLQVTFWHLFFWQTLAQSMQTFVDGLLQKKCCDNTACAHKSSEILHVRAGQVTGRFLPLHLCWGSCWQTAPQYGCILHTHLNSKEEESVLFANSSLCCWSCGLWNAHP